ncbi:undecaprenyl-phosphate galactose phosphotransferase WbaP [Thermodesulfatator atlanticus]|uniref:undecaprenyl-phosphate galactose phosphotransferase WbaP n=1 Tax=Thermodesulfatator atlanticus TaxID=501497 RepID=UPI0003B4B336|nr:undecaprenyl-phosphate galactose phosphotransferase WbaP [Thermodesulfatator atlanticus]
MAKLANKPLLNGTINKVIKVYPQTLWQTGKERPEYYLALLLGDIFAVLLSVFLAVVVRYELGKALPQVPFLSLSQAWLILKKFWWLLLVVPFCLGYLRTYDRRLPFWEETREVIKALILSFIIIYALLAVRKNVNEVSRLLLGLSFIFSCFLVPCCRYFTKKILFSLRAFRRKALILGAGEGTAELIRALSGEKYLGYEVIGLLDDDPARHGRLVEGKKVYGGLKQIGKFIRFLNIESVFIAVPSFTSKQLSELFANVQGMVKEVCIVPEFKNFGMLNAETHTLFHEKLFLIKVRNNLKSPLNQFIKRSFDLTLSFLLLPVLLPVMGIIAVLIVLDSPGSPIFAHERIGRNGRKFKVYKFRSMYKNSKKILEEYLQKNPEALKEWNTYYKLKNDPRITKVGKFLRLTSLDELPQIFNVIKGDMSLVGPRPVTCSEIDTYYQDYASFYFMVRPGITGLWQVSGRSNLTYEDRVKMDVWYVLNWSLWLDFTLLVKTISVVIKREGSY